MLRAIGHERLLLAQADLNAPLPLATASVDVLFSHDVLELLGDHDALLHEARRVLRPDGRLVIGHADFDTAVFAGADLELTRRIVHTFCDLQQDWMRAVDGTIGRRLPEIVSRSGFAVRDVRARVLLTRSLEPGGFGRFALDHVSQALATSDAIGAAELGDWRADLQAAAERGSFLFSLNDYVVLAQRENSHEQPR